MLKRNRAHQALLSGLLIWSAFAQAQDGLVTTKHLQEQWIGKMLTVHFPNATASQLQFKSDSTITIAGSLTDSGTWRWHEPNGYCATWKKIRNGQERCFTVQRNGKEYVVLHPDGTISGMISEIK